MVSKKLEGNIVWVDKNIFYGNVSTKTKVYHTLIRDAVLTDTGISFSCRSNGLAYYVQMQRIKDTNYQGSFTVYDSGKEYKFKINFQVFENRLGLILEGDWDEDTEVAYWCIAKLYYV